MVGMETDAIRLRCECGHKIRCMVRSWGRSLDSFAFFDDRAPGETGGERVEFCPGCGARLAVALFSGRLGESALLLTSRN